MPKSKTNGSLLSEIRRWRTYHAYFKRTGFYHFVLHNAIKVGIAVIVLLAVFLIFQRSIIEYKPEFQAWLDTLRWGAVFVVFLISESFLGLLPPDFFILWSYEFEYPYLAVTVLALLSFGGGVVSYFIGRRLSLNEYVRNYLSHKYSRFFRLIKQWGGFFVLVAALFPIPFSIVCILVGMVNFPKRRFLLYSSSRIVRFYLYAIALFAVMN